MNWKYTKDIEKYAFHGIDQHIDAEETVVVNLRDLMRVQATLAEYVRFFHQPLNYPLIEDVESFLGDYKSPGAYHLLHKTNYKIMLPMLPDHMDELFDLGVFDAEELPHYYKPKDED